MNHSPETIALAIAIADEIATSDIELLCDGHTGLDGALWYDTENVEPDDQDAVAKSVEYLTARELLVRKDNDPKQVAFRRLQ